VVNRLGQLLAATAFIFRAAQASFGAFVRDPLGSIAHGPEIH